MPTSLPEPDIEGRRLALYAASLFLLNYLLAPGLAFGLLAWLWWQHRDHPSRLARNHLAQAFHACWRGGALLVAGTLLPLAFGTDTGQPWMWALLWLVCGHACLVIGGILGLARALAGRSYRFPLLGPAVPL